MTDTLLSTDIHNTAVQTQGEYGRFGRLARLQEQNAYNRLSRRIRYSGETIATAEAFNRVVNSERNSKRSN